MKEAGNNDGLYKTYSRKALGMHRFKPHLGKTERSFARLGADRTAFRCSPYFHSRPSVTGPFPYNAAFSSASNFGQFNSNLEKAVKERVKALRSIIPAGGKIPVDLATSSGSGLDQHISPAAAFLQAASVVGARNADEAKIGALVDKYREDKLFGIFGETVVNAVKLNIALDELP